MHVWWFVGSIEKVLKELLSEEENVPKEMKSCQGGQAMLSHFVRRKVSHISAMWHARTILETIGKEN